MGQLRDVALTCTRTNVVGAILQQHRHATTDCAPDNGLPSVLHCVALQLPRALEKVVEEVWERARVEKVAVARHQLPVAHPDLHADLLGARNGQ